jgi:thiol-disulfide isomerase/thioredoxin
LSGRRPGRTVIPFQRNLWFAAGLAVLLVPARALTPEAAPGPDWPEFLAGLPPPKVARPDRSLPMVEHYKWAYGHLLPARLAVTMDYLDRHPANPTRWQAVQQLENIFMAWDRALGKEPPAVIAEVDKVMPAEERAACVRKIDGLVAALYAADDVPGGVRLYFDSRPVRQAIQAAMTGRLPADAPEWSSIRNELDALAARYPLEADLANAVRSYLAVRYPADGDVARKKQELESLTGSANAGVASLARQTLQRDELFGKPLELAFTAVDGRKVDLKDLRGKVVLIDFWATWCGPCIAELPNIKKVYAEYHDKGFEIIGITLENARLAPSDTPGQTAAKLEAAKKVLTDFTTKERMPWPQYFDGKFWKNDISTRYDIQAIPAMFLLDPDGKIVSTNARGEKLEAEVKRLLKL